MRITSLLFVMLAMLASCSKEYSNENGAIISNECRLSSIAAADSLSGKSFFALNTKFGTNDVANYIEVFDSVNSTSDPREDLVYSGDTVKLGTSGSYAILDGAKRVKLLYSPAPPSTFQIPSLTYNYTYDAGGFLTLKTISFSGLPIPAVRFTYTWNANNLVKVEGVSVILGTSTTLLSATMTYDAGKTVKNFIPIYPDGFESALYIMALNFGKPSKNLLKSVVLKTFDNTGAPLDTYSTNIKNALISGEGYLSEWYAEGDSFDALGLFGGLNKFGYRCK
jgi:hypothetical protein